MKFFFVIFFYLFQTIWNNLSGQDLVLFQDTINNFSIGVPKGWKYYIPLEDKSVPILVYRQKLNKKDIPREMFSIQLFHKNEIDIEKSFNSFLELNRRVDGFKLLMQGEKTINGRKFKYLLSSFKDKLSKDDMTISSYFTNESGKILLFTIGTTSPNYEKYKDLFETVALSLNF